MKNFRYFLFCVIALGVVFYGGLSINAESISSNDISNEVSIEENLYEDIQARMTIDYFSVNYKSHQGSQVWHTQWRNGYQWRGYLQYQGRTGWLGLSGDYNYAGRLTTAPIAPNSEIVTIP